MAHRSKPGSFPHMDPLRVVFPSLYQEGEQFTSVFIVHRPYFQHPVTKIFWTQDQAYEWKTVPHSFPLDHDPNLVSTLKQYRFELNNFQSTPIDIQHTSLGP